MKHVSPPTYLDVSWPGRVRARMIIMLRHIRIDGLSHRDVISLGLHQRENRI